MLSTRRMEHGTPLLVDFDLGALMGAREAFENEDHQAIGQFTKILAVAGKSFAVRRLSAVARATEDQLRQAEGDATILANLEEEAAARPYAECFEDAVGFFAAWGRSFSSAPDSSAAGVAKAKPKKAPSASPSAASSLP